MKRTLFLILCLKMGTLYGSLGEMETGVIASSRKLCLGWIHRLEVAGNFGEGDTAQIAKRLCNSTVISAARLSPRSFVGYLAARKKFVPDAPSVLVQKFDSYVNKLRRGEKIVNQYSV